MNLDLSSQPTGAEHAPTRNRAMQMRMSLYSFIGALVIVLCISIWMIRPYLISLAMGAILALLTMPLMRRLERRMNRNLAAGLVTFGVILLVVGPLVVFSALALRQASGLVTWFMQTELMDVNALLARIGGWLPTDFLREHVGDVHEQLGGLIKEAAQTVASSTLDVAKSVPAGLLQMALACLACFFFLLDGARFFHWLGGKLPLDDDVRRRLAEAFKDTAISVVWASMAAAGTQALVMFLGFVILGVPGAFVAGGATFVFAWIPLLGSTPVWAVGAVVLGAQGAYTRALVMLGFGLVAGTVDNFVRPLVLRGRGEMHPLVSLVAIFGGLSLFGFFGVFFGPIIAAVTITLLQVWPIVGRRSGLEIGGGEIVSGGSGPLV